MRKTFVVLIILIFCISYLVKPVNLDSVLMLKNYLFDFSFPLFFPIVILIFLRLAFNMSIDYARGIHISLGLAFLYETVQLYYGVGDMLDFGAYLLGPILYWIVFHRKEFYLDIQLSESPPGKD